MEPFTLAGITGLLGATKTSVDIASSTYGLLQKVREGREDPESVDAQLLRLALLAVDRNIVVLEGVQFRVDKEHREALFGVAPLLEIAPLAALLVNWPVPDAEAELPRRATQKDFDAWSTAMEDRQSDEQLLANARYIVARTSGLCALAQLDAGARKQLRLSQRLANLQAAHRRLRDLLSNEETLGHLIHRRKEVAGGPPPAPTA